MNAQVFSYLESLEAAVVCPSDDLMSAVATCHNQRESSAEHLTESALQRLALRRMLASNSLSRSSSAERDERRFWDEANHWVHQFLSNGGNLKVEHTAIINSLVTGAQDRRPSGPRECALYSCGQQYLPHEQVPAALEWLQWALDRPQLEPILKAGLLYCALVTIHPYRNGNGRTARLAADTLLLASGFLPVCFPSPVSSHVAQMCPLEYTAGKRPLEEPQAKGRVAVRDAGLTLRRFVRGVQQSYTFISRSAAQPLA